MKLTVFITTLLISVNSFAFGMCDNDATLKKLWDTQYQQIVQTPDPSNFNHQGYTYKVSKALCFLGDSGLPSNFNFLGLIREFVTGAIVNLQKPTPAWAKAIFPNEIELYAPYFSNDRGMEIKRASTLVHEARHLQMNSKNIPNNIHVVCNNNGALNGVNNCDEEFVANWDTAGATSYEVLFFRKLYEDSSYNLNRTDIKLWIISLLDNNFNHVSPELRERFTR